VTLFPVPFKLCYQCLYEQKRAEDLRFGSGYLFRQQVIELITRPTRIRDRAIISFSILVFICLTAISISIYNVFTCQDISLSALVSAALGMELLVN